MQAQGYVRFRVDGQIYEHENLPAEEDREARHRRGDRPRRCAPTCSSAWPRASKPPCAWAPPRPGRVLALEMDTGRAPVQQQVRLPGVQLLAGRAGAAPVLLQLAHGRLPACDGLGQQEVFDPERVVAFPSLSLASGAIKGWDRRNGYYFAMLESLAAHYGFDVETPFEELPAVQHVVLHGSGDEEIASATSSTAAPEGQGHRQAAPFEGIMPNMARATARPIPVVREDLARYRSTQPCPDCHGTRLRREARHVRVGEGAQARAIYEVSHATLPTRWPGSRSSAAPRPRSPTRWCARSPRACSS
jgi:excinuclease ABC subunit A